MINFRFNKIKNKKLIVASFILVIIFILVFYSLHSNKSKFDFVKAKRGSIYQVVSGTGQVKAERELGLSFEVPGKIQEIKVQEGDTVKKGDTIISLDSRGLKNELLSAKANEEIAQVNLDRLIEGASPEDIKISQVDVDNARIALSNAKVSLSDAQKKLSNANDENEKELNKVYQGALVIINSSYDTFNKALLKTLKNLKENVFPPDIALDSRYDLAKLALLGDDENKGADYYINQANITLDHNDIDKAIDRLQEAANKVRNCLTFSRDAMEGPGYENYVTTADKSAIDAEIINVDTAISSLDSAKQSIVAQRISNQNNITNAESNLDNCQSAFKMAQGNLNSALARLDKLKSPPRDLDINEAKAQLEQAKANLALTEDKLSKTKLLAPIDGVITKEYKKIGETVSAQEVVVSIIGLGKFQIESDIPEADISKIKIGDLVKITFDSLPNIMVTSSVAEISPASTMIEGVPTYKITIYLQRDIPGLKAGMTANIDISTASKRDVIFIPRRAIIEKNGKEFVRLMTSNKNYKEVPVETGIYGEQGNIEIIKGLKEGDKVITLIHNASH